MQVEKEIERPSYSRDELIALFLEADARNRESYSIKHELAQAIADIAAEGRGDQATVYVQDSKGRKVKVFFGQDTSYETAEMVEASKLLGPEVFDGLFETKIKFTPRRRALSLFLNTVSASEGVETAKELIRNAMRTEDKSPSVSVVK